MVSLEPVVDYLVFKGGNIPFWSVIKETYEQKVGGINHTNFLLLLHELYIMQQNILSMTSYPFSVTSIKLPLFKLSACDKKATYISIQL